MHKFVTDDSARLVDCPIFWIDVRMLDESRGCPAFVCPISGKISRAKFGRVMFCGQDRVLIRTAMGHNEQDTRLQLTQPENVSWRYAAHVMMPGSRQQCLRLGCSLTRWESVHLPAQEKVTEFTGCIIKLYIIREEVPCNWTKG